MKRDALALLLGVSKGKKDSEGGDLHDAARDILDAIRDDDADALVSALQRFVCECPEDDAEDDDHDFED